MSEEKCLHTDTHFEGWPDGGEIEVCNNCGKSRHLTEISTSNWIFVDVEKERKELERYLR